jgi:hypothetical protein
VGNISILGQFPNEIEIWHSMLRASFLKCNSC